MAERPPVVSNATPLMTLRVEAKRAGLIPAVGTVLDAMVAQGRSCSSRLRATLLEAAGEDAS